MAITKPAAAINTMVEPIPVVQLSLALRLVSGVQRKTKTRGATTFFLDSIGCW